MIKAHGEPSPLAANPTWRLVVAPAKGTVEFAGFSAGSQVDPGAEIARVVDPARHLPGVRAARWPGHRVAGGGRRPRRSRSTPPATAPRGGARIMSELSNEQTTPRAQISPPSGARHAAHPGRRRLPARARRHQRRDLRAHRLLGPVDPRALGHHHARLGRARTRRSSTWPRPPPRTALDRAGIDPSQLGAVLVATVSHLSRPLPPRRMLTHNRRGDTPAAAHATSRPPAPASATASAWPTTWSAAAAPSTSSSSASSSSPTSPTSTDRSHRVHLRRRRRRGRDRPVRRRPGIGPTVWGSDGAQSDAIRQKHSWIELKDEGRSTGRRSRCRARRVFRWAVWQMAQVAQQALEQAGVSRRRPRRVHPAPGEHADHRRDGQAAEAARTVPIARDIATTGNTCAASIPLATDRMLDEGQAAARRAALQIGFGAGLVYAAQVVPPLVARYRRTTRRTGTD